MNVLGELAFELNNVCEYADLPVEVQVTPAGQKGHAHVHVLATRGAYEDEVYLVDYRWCLDNAKRLPDHCLLSQLRQCLAVSHPDVKGVSDKHTR